MIRLIIFDLDGVLCDTRPLHFKALNSALEQLDAKYVISPEEHEAKFDGLPTSKKLQMLSEEKGLATSNHDWVWMVKQAETARLIREELSPNPELQNLLKTLKSRGLLLYVASNSVRITLDAMLHSLGVAHLFDQTFSNNDVQQFKPHPEIYMRCVLKSELSPRQVMICEDSPVGRRAAIESGCHLCPIESPATLTLSHLDKYIEYFEKYGIITEHQIPWIEPRMNVVIPMAGAGSRFRRAGFKQIKPLIDVHGKPMIQRVIQNLNLKANHIFICQTSHIQEFNLSSVLPWLMSERQTLQIVGIEGLSAGAACTILAVEKSIDNDEPLLIANSDQFIEFSMTAFMYKMQSASVDGGILVFDSEPDAKWSYAKIDNKGWVTEVQEKNPISRLATVGIYYWKKGSDFVKYAKQMMAKNIRVNNEFYVCPVYNEAIADGKKIAVFHCDRMWGLGTPEDLDTFHKNFEMKWS